jgi:hypothetical protein
MSKEAAAGSSQSGLIYLKYTFWFRDQFDEPNDDWLDAIEATSDELLGAYSWAEDKAMTVAFDARGKKRLNMVFDVIRFIYLDYCFHVRKQKGKRKIATWASSSAPKAMKVKVLTRRPRRIEMVDVPELIERARVAPSATEPGHAVPVEASTNPAKELKLEKTTDQLKVLSPLGTIGLPKPSSVPAVTPRKSRMASVLETVLESVKTSAPSTAKALNAQTKDARKTVVASVANAPAEAGPSEAHAKARPSETTPIALEKESVPEKSKSPTPEAPLKELEFIFWHASGKQLAEEQVAEVQHYAKYLRYPRGSFVYGGNDEDDFLYYLSDSKEIHVCREIMDNIWYPKLELGLSAMSKDQLADSLTYNSLKVCVLWLVYFYGFSYHCYILTLCFPGLNSRQSFEGIEGFRGWELSHSS